MPPKKITAGQWGGFRPGAGRKPKDPTNPMTPHKARGPHRAACPVIATLRAKKRAPNLQSDRPFATIVAALAEASSDDFRVLAFSVRPDRVLLLVEATDAGALSSGMRGACVRIARNVNAAVGRRGPLWGDRWRGDPLTTAPEVRAALVDLRGDARHTRAAVTPPRTSLAAAALRSAR